MLKRVCALGDFSVEFKGQRQHASADPWNGRSASDALELYAWDQLINREHNQTKFGFITTIQDAGPMSQW